MENNNYIFISYSHQDKNIVYPIIKKFVDENYNIWWDNGIPHSEDYHEIIADHIRTAGVFIAFLSSNYNQSNYCQKELKYAFKLGKKIVPVYLESNLTLSNGLEMLVSNLHTIFYSDTESCYRQLITSPAISTYSEGSYSTNTGKTDGISIDGCDIVTRTHKRKGFREFIFYLLAIIGLSFPLIWVFIFHNEFNYPLRIIYSAILVFFTWWLLDEIETNPQVAASCFGTIQIEELFKKPEVLSSRIASTFGDRNYISTVHDVNGFSSLYKWTRLEFGSWDDSNINYLHVRFRVNRKKGFTLGAYDPSVFYLHSLSKGNQAIKMLTRQGFILQEPLSGTTEKMHFLRNGSIRVILCYQKKHLYEMYLFNCTSEEFGRRLLTTDERLNKKFSVR